MKKTCLIALLALLALPVSSEAQIKVEMNKITCGDWLGYNREQQDFVRFWMSGYYNGAANNSVLDYKRLQTNSAKVAAYCKKNKSKTLPTAIKQSLS
jgi:hypothetical protein